MDEAANVQRLRSWGWAYTLDLVARGLGEDAVVCEGEKWPRTTAELLACSALVGALADAVRRRIRKGEDSDRAAGCE